MTTPDAEATRWHRRRDFGQPSVCKQSASSTGPGLRLGGERPFVRHLKVAATVKSTMNARGAEDVTELLRAWSDGDQRALDGLTPIVYAELRRLAHRYMKRERPDHSLQATALVNEAYLRLVDCTRMQWKDRAHFFAVSAQLMRRILVDHARRNNVKRGRGVPHVSFDETAVVQEPEANLVALDDAMHALARLDPRKVQVVEMRFFSGLSVEETAEVLKVSPVTVRRDWSSAKIWLYRELTGHS